MSAERLPDFVIIGAGKSASTWLHHALRRHPAIFMPDGESPFFEDPYYNPNDLGALLKESEGARADALTGIKRPNYLCTPECAPRIARHLPNAKLIAILRDPVERAVSQYFHLIRGGRIPLAPADQAFDQYLSGKFDSPVTKRMIMDFGCYAEGLSNYRKFFPSERIFLLTDIELRQGMQAAFQKACRYLGVQDDFVPAYLEVPRNQGTYFTPMLAVLKKMNNLRRAYDEETGHVVVRSGLVARAAGHVVSLGSRLSGAARMVGGSKAPPISADTHERLLRYYLPDILELEKMANIDLSAWKSPRALQP